jgi:hypothetical protein
MPIMQASAYKITDDTASVEVRHSSLYSRLTPLITAIAIALSVAISFYQLVAPGAVGSGATATEFSSARAMERLRVIAQKPHPVGSAEHAKALDYITTELATMGFKPEIQETTSVSRRRRFPVVAATVRNVIVRWPGTDNTKSVLLAAHYDSVSTGPGASDNAAAVVTLLETLRALKAGPRLRNDMIFLFTDAEEIGLLGAQAFVDESALSKDLGVALNFEARGTSGPSIMFETSGQNEWVIKEFARAAPYPVANSLSYEIYKRLPNDTDLTVFKDAGVAGLNFAYIKGLNHYHTQLDSVSNIDESSLQHHGSYSLALARQFGDSDFNQKRPGNAIYFNFFSRVIHYPVAWAIPFAVFVAIAFLAVTFYGLRTGQLRVSGVILGFFALLASVIASALIATFAWWAINKAHSQYRLVSQGDVYNGYLYLLSFVALSVAVTSAIYAKLWAKASVESLAVGGLVWWLILAIGSSLYLSGASYLFIWPLLLGLVALAFMLVSRNWAADGPKRLTALSICAVPGIVLFVPIIYLVFLAMTLSMSAVLAVMVVLLLGLLIPQLRLMAGSRKWMLPAVASLICFVFIVAGSATSGLDSNHRQTNSVFYVMNADTSKALWGSLDQRPDEWTAQFLAGKIERGSMGDYLASNYDGFLKAQANPLPLNAPSVELLDDSLTDEGRAIRLRITSPRQAPIVTVSTDANTEVITYSVNQKRIANQGGQRWGLRYYGIPKEGVELSLVLKASGSVTLMVTDQSYGLPEGPTLSFTPRPDHMMASILPFSDMTLVTKSFTFHTSSDKVSLK